MNRYSAVFLDFRNTNSLWCSVAVETGVRLGITQAVISPGSRSTALTMALTRHPGFEAIPVLDERSAAFFALGLAKRSWQPVILVCTSGTAGANYFPAVIEARESAVPLIIVTADRPPELRECRSSQTIDQQKLFGGYVNFYHELSVPEAALPALRYLRQMLVHATERSLFPVAGPVHLNMPFRDPLAPIADGRAEKLEGKIGEEFFAEVSWAFRSVAKITSASRLRGRGLIIAGQTQPKDATLYAEAVGKIVGKLGWPVLADPLSGLRGFTEAVPGLVTVYDVVARSPKWREVLVPERILCLEDWPISKPLRQWLEPLDVATTIVSLRGQNPDALHARTNLVRGTVEDFAEALPKETPPAGWRENWDALEQRTADSLQRRLCSIDWLFEGRAAALLAEQLPRETSIFVANSMPVRDVEYFWAEGKKEYHFYFSRGANGIDGTLSTALGVAHHGRPVVLLTGDLALLHDTNGFLQSGMLAGSLTIVLINNTGGGIFEHLPVAQFEPPFEKFFGTPQAVSFAKLCAAYEVKHTMVKNWVHFIRLVRKLPEQGVHVLELRTDRKRDAAFRKKLFAELVDRLG